MSDSMVEGPGVPGTRTLRAEAIAHYVPAPAPDRRRTVKRTLGVLMALEGITFAVASYLHLGGHIPLGFTVITGEPVRRAAIPEATIAAVLTIGCLAVLAIPSRAWPLALVSVAFATFGTVLGLSLVATGIGPRTVPDLTYHASILTVLLANLLLLFRERSLRTGPMANESLSPAGESPLERTAHRVSR